MIQIEKRMYATFLGQKKQQKIWFLVGDHSSITSSKKMAFFDDLQYCKSSEVDGWAYKKLKNMMT